MWRELNTPDVDCLERSIARAVKRAEQQSPGLRLKQLLLGGESPGWSFSTTIDVIGRELPQLLREECPGITLPSDAEVTHRCVRAIRAAVAGSENDVVAQRILEAHDSAERLRARWLPVTASVLSGTVVFALADFEVTKLTHETSIAIASGLVAAAVAIAPGAAWFGIISVGSVQDTQGALRKLVDALLEPNVTGYVALTPVEELNDSPLAPVVIRELERIVTLLDHGARALPGPRRYEVMYRWDGEECDAIASAIGDLKHSLRKLKAHPDWVAPVCVVQTTHDLLDECSKAREGELEVQVSVGSTVFRLFVCCGALADALDRALDIPRRQAA
jgi:hypothetical protein